MGIIVAKEEKFKRVCRSCRELIIIIGSGADICVCPYCGHTLMDTEPDEEDLKLSLDQTHQALLKFRNSTDSQGDKLTLQIKLRELFDNLEFYGKDQRRWHRWQCSCGWSGYEPKIIPPQGAIPGKMKCPECGNPPINTYSELSKFL